MQEQAQMVSPLAPLLLQILEHSRLEEELADSFAMSQRSFRCTCEQPREKEDKHEEDED